MRRAGELAAARPVCGVCAMRKRPTWVVLDTTPRSNGTSVLRREITPVATLDWSTKRADLGDVLAERPAVTRCGNLRSATAPMTEITSVEIVCATTIASKCLDHAVVHTDDDRKQAEGRGPGLVDARRS